MATFNDLPFAIQSKVWRLSWLPRRVQVKTDSVNGGFVSRAWLPSSFHVHRASRAFSIKNYRRNGALDLATMPFFNPDLDTLVVSRPGCAENLTARQLSIVLASLAAQHVHLTRSLTLTSDPSDAPSDLTLHHIFHSLVSAATVKSIMFYRESTNGAWHVMCLVRYMDDADRPSTFDIVTIDPESPEKWGPRYRSLNPWNFDPNPLSKLWLRHAIIFAKSSPYEGGWRLLLPLPNISQISCELVWFLAIYNAWQDHVVETSRLRRGEAVIRSLASHLSLAWQEDLRFLIDGICTAGSPELGESLTSVDIVDEIVDANFHYVADVMESQINGWWPNAKLQRQRAYRDAIKQGIMQNTYQIRAELIETSRDNKNNVGWKRWQENLDQWRRIFQR